MNWHGIDTFNWLALSVFDLIFIFLLLSSLIIKKKVIVFVVGVLMFLWKNKCTVLIILGHSGQ